MMNGTWKVIASPPMFILYFEIHHHVILRSLQTVNYIHSIWYLGFVILLVVFRNVMGRGDEFGNEDTAFGYVSAEY